MKRIMVSLLCCLLAAWAFSKDNLSSTRQYGPGAVPVENGKVTFRTSIPLPSGTDLDNCYERMLNWAKGRFALPYARNAYIVSENPENHRFVFNVEQTIVFKSSAFEHDDARIIYNFALNMSDGNCNVTVTDIKYRYEEERYGGGMSFTAEDWITDEECYNRKRTKFLKKTGKFRIKTIDMKDVLFKRVEEELTGK
ncbi:MAG: DUF4468 domain-containing protein [Bacteroidaceae bacterium]|nr:DUF4468 domain-containing protein [Bacteroidaceae bacterium]MBR7079320.1 DUF4468 domain-containing protein [Treponema sp.]